MKSHQNPVMPIRNRIALFSVEYGIVERSGSALVVTDKRGVRAQIPVGATAVIMLEPGSTISHEAVKLCAEARTLIIWVGQGSVRLYSAGQEGSAHSYRLLRQARLALDKRSRLAVAREMYRIRFDEDAPRKRSIQQLRGMEGARVRARYKELSQQYEVPWRGRNYDRSNWKGQDPINRAISTANSCLYGLCHAAILIAGYSAAIGFIHTGYPLAFVHDVADIWKMDIAAETAFRIVGETGEASTMQVRHELRDQFRTSGMLDDVIPMIARLLDAGEKEDGPPEELGGATEDPTDPWSFPWYRKTASGETVGTPESHAPRGDSSSTTSSMSNEDRPQSSESGSEEPDDEFDEGKLWADEIFGEFDDPWKRTDDQEDTP